MTIDLIRVGNSRGIRIPKAFLDECGLREKAELEVRKGVLVIRPVRAPQTARQGWDEAFRKMAAHGDDRMLDGEQAAGDWDKSEWEWN